jgi:hypothetical protein
VVWHVFVGGLALFFAVVSILTLKELEVPFTLTARNWTRPWQTWPIWRTWRSGNANVDEKLEIHVTLGESASRAIGTTSIVLVLYLIVLRWFPGLITTKWQLLILVPLSGFAVGCAGKALWEVSPALRQSVRQGQIKAKAIEIVLRVARLSLTLGLLCFGGWLLSSNFHW